MSTSSRYSSDSSESSPSGRDYTSSAATVASSSHRNPPFGIACDIAQPYKLLTSKYIRYVDGFDSSYIPAGRCLLLARAYLCEALAQTTAYATLHEQ